VNGTRLAYLDVGVAGTACPPVVLIHGFGGDASNWGMNLASLAATRRVIVPELPGHGGSSKHVERGTVDEFAALIGELLSRLDVLHAHVVGHSLGGSIAIRLARLQPGLVRSLVLVAPMGLGATVNGEFIARFVAAQSRRELTSVVGVLFHDASLASRELVENLQKYKRIDGVTAALASIANAAFPGGRVTMRLNDDLAALMCPVLVIWGDSDAVIESAQCSTLPPHARLKRLANAGHLPQLEAAAEFNALLADHLDRAD
jgi:pyruvate dehydrogenase E2 component (dihydrolipoamide acetyltransferase)